MLESIGPKMGLIKRVDEYGAAALTQNLDEDEIRHKKFWMMLRKNEE